MISASSPGQAAANCPACGVPSSRVHGRYRRLLQDLPAGGWAVLTALTIRQLRCGVGRWWGGWRRTRR
ncbi:transposase family protein [Streptosporangium sp. NPDC001559]|uniref:transposase family protein n=1 Tax=Streptosporangium sp. NPDC001559 TaxID=3366187 RepID=UPI0036EEB455